MDWNSINGEGNRECVYQYIYIIQRNEVVSYLIVHCLRGLVEPQRLIRQRWPRKSCSLEVDQFLPLDSGPSCLHGSSALLLLPLQWHDTVLSTILAAAVYHSFLIFVNVAAVDALVLKKQTKKRRAIHKCLTWWKLLYTWRWKCLRFRLRRFFRLFFQRRCVALSDELRVQRGRRDSIAAGSNRSFLKLLICTTVLELYTTF